MTIRELIEELNAMVANGEVNVDARVRNAEDDSVESVVASVYNNNEVVIYF